MFQSTVNTFQGFGVPGELATDSPRRVRSLIINSNAATPNVYGYAATQSGLTNVAQMGGIVGPGTATFTGSIAGTTLTVTAIAAGALQKGQAVGSYGTIVGYGTGVGGIGTYTMSASNTVASGTLNATGGVPTVFAGIMAESKEATSWGTTSGTLAPTLAIPDQAQADFATMGDIVVVSGTACNIGDAFAYNILTGALSTYPVGGSVPAGCAPVPNSAVYRYPVTSGGGGLTIARLTN